jgi:hypothetical protein
MERDNLRLIIRRKLAQDLLPTDSIPRFWGAPANGEQCDACEETISSTQVIMEGISQTTNQGLQLHVECFSIWDEERDESTMRQGGN